MIRERWLPVAGYEGLYEVSDSGRVRNVRGRLLTLVTLEPGRLRVSLSKGGVSKSHYVHRLVLLAFVGEPPEGHEAAHWDGDPTNNTLSNLRWTTHVDNEADKLRHGTRQRGEACSAAILTEGDVRRIREIRGKGLSYSAVGRLFGIATSQAHAVCKKTWRHVSA